MSGAKVYHGFNGQKGLTHYYKFVLYHYDGNVGECIKFCITAGDIKSYKKHFLKGGSIERVEVYRVYVEFVPVEGDF